MGVFDLLKSMKCLGMDPYSIRRVVAAWETTTGDTWDAGYLLQLDHGSFVHLMAARTGPWDSPTVLDMVAESFQSEPEPDRLSSLPRPWRHDLADLNDRISLLQDARLVEACERGS